MNMTLRHLVPDNEKNDARSLVEEIEDENI
jgi:hypothetical protein